MAKQTQQQRQQARQPQLAKAAVKPAIEPAVEPAIEPAIEPKVAAAHVKVENVIKAVDPTKPGGKALTWKEKAAVSNAALTQRLNPGVPDSLRCGGVAAVRNTRA